MPDGRPPVDAKELGQRLKELRGERSQDDVVRAIEKNQGFRLSSAALSLLERGEIANPGARTLDVLAREYARAHGPWVTVEFLLYGVKDGRRKAARG